MIGFGILISEIVISKEVCDASIPLLASSASMNKKSHPQLLTALLAVHCYSPLRADSGK